MIELRSALLVLLSILAFLDFSLVALYLRGILCTSNLLMMVFVGLFFVSGPASWIVALNTKDGVRRVAAALLPAGLAASLYSAVLSSALRGALFPEAFQIIAVPVGLVIAMIGLFELMVDPSVKTRLENAYRVYLASLQPYTLVMIAVVAATLALLHPPLVYALLALTVYSVILAHYAGRCARRVGGLGVAGLGVTVLVYTLLAYSLHVDVYGLVLGGLLIAGLFAATLVARGGGGGPLCPVEPLVASTAAVAVASLPYASPVLVLKALPVFLAVGVIGWSVNLALVAFSDTRLAGLVRIVVRAPEARIAAGLSLLLVGFETMGVSLAYATPLLVAGGVAAAVINEGLGRRGESVKGRRVEVEARGG